MSTSTSIPRPTLRRPTRWDFPFSDEMTKVDIDQICNIAPFSQLDENNFRKPFSIEQILRNDSRIRYCNPGDVVVREGEFGNSVLFVMFGRMKVSLDPRRSANRRSTQRRGGPLQTLLDWWAKRQAPEVRLRVKHSQQLFERHDRDNGQQFLYLPDIGQSLRDDRTATLQAGQFFGEVAALGRTPRCATITAETSAALFEIRWQGIRDIMRRDDCVKQYIEESFRRRTLGSLLKNVQELKALDETDIDELVKQADFESYGEFRATKPSKSKDDSSGLIGYTSEPTIRKQGKQANDILLLRTGVARVSYQTGDAQRAVSYLTPGQVFGMEELFSCVARCMRWDTSRSCRFPGTCSKTCCTFHHSA